MISSLSREIALTGMSRLGKCIARSTWHDKNPSDDKDIKQILKSSKKSSEHENAYTVQCILTRLRDSRWQVVLKALFVIHRCIRDGSQVIVREVCRLHERMARSELSNMCDFDSFGFNQFVCQYSSYLHLKMKVMAEIGYDIERIVRVEHGNIQSWMQNMPLTDLQRLIPLVHRVLNALTDCACNTDGDSVQLLLRAPLVALFKDGIRLLSVLTFSAITLMDRFRELDYVSAEWSLNEIKMFFPAQESFMKWTRNLCKCHLVEQQFLPDFNTIPSSIVQTLTQALDEKNKKSRRCRSKSSSRERIKPCKNKQSKEPHTQQEPVEQADDTHPFAHANHTKNNNESVQALSENFASGFDFSSSLVVASQESEALNQQTSTVLCNTPQQLTKPPPDKKKTQCRNSNESQLSTENMWMSNPFNM